MREVSAENFVGRRDSALVTEKIFVLYISGDYLPLKVPITVIPLVLVVEVLSLSRGGSALGLRA